jgi:hypothetical protein
MNESIYTTLNKTGTSLPFKIVDFLTGGHKKGDQFKF